MGSNRIHTITKWALQIPVEYIRNLYRNLYGLMFDGGNTVYPQWYQLKTELIININQAYIFRLIKQLIWIYNLGYVLCI